MSDEGNGLTGGQITTQSAGGSSLAMSSDRMAAGIQAEMTAWVIGRLEQAARFPRNLDVIRQRMLAHTRRHEFADNALYRLPRGMDRETGKRKYIIDLNIRAAEAIFAEWGWMHTDTMVVSETAEERIVKVIVSDLQKGNSYSRNIVVPKTVERRYPPKDREILYTRTNSEGNAVHVVRATPAEIAQEQASLQSRAIRTEGLRLIPYDLKSEFKRAIYTTMEKGQKEDPDRHKRMADSFRDLGVTAEQLSAYVGRRLEDCSAEQYADLRAIMASMREEGMSWEDLTDAGAEPDKGVSATQEKLRKRRETTAKPQTAKSETAKPTAAKSDKPKSEPDAEGEARVAMGLIDEIGALGAEKGLTLDDIRKIGQDMAESVRFDVLEDLSVSDLTRLRGGVRKHGQEG